MAFKPQNDEGTVELANSLADYAGFVSYFQDRGVSFSTPQAEVEPLLVRATDFINTQGLYNGIRRYDNQGTVFPRDDLKDRDGFVVSGIPKEVKFDCFELTAWLILNPDKDLFVDYDPSTSNIQSEMKKVASLSKSITYFGTQSSRYSVGKAMYIKNSGYLLQDEGRLYI